MYELFAGNKEEIAVFWRVLAIFGHIWQFRWSDQKIKYL